MKKLSVTDKKTHSIIGTCIFCHVIVVVLFCFCFLGLSAFLLLHSLRLKHQHILMCFNNLPVCRYESGTLGDIWPLGRVTLNLHGPFLTNDTFASDILVDVLYPETPIILQDLHLIGNQSIQHFRAAAARRPRSGHRRSRKQTYFVFC